MDGEVGRIPIVRYLDTAEKARVALGIPSGSGGVDALRGSTNDEFAGRAVVDVSIAVDEAASSESSSGVPPSGFTRARAVCESDHPWVVAEFARTLIVYRDGKRLVERCSSEYPFPRWEERRESRWFMFGEIVRADDGPLTVGSVSIQPWPNGSGAALRGITMELLRAIHPSDIIRDVMAHRRSAEVQPNDQDPRGVGHAFVASDVWLVAPVVEGASRRGRTANVSDVQLGRWSWRYLDLASMGVSIGIHKQLATEFGITPQASREWKRSAVHRKFLAPIPRRVGGRKGRHLPPRETDD